MSLIDENDTSLTREDAINQVIASIASEELSLSCLINAEGEKLQSILGTLPGATGASATIEEVLEANRSISQVLASVAENQTTLSNKLKNVLSSAILTGPTGPTGPPGSIQIFGIQAKLRKQGGLPLRNGGTILFDDVPTIVGSAITYDETTGVFTLSQSGYYRVDWWATIDGADSTRGIVLALNVNEEMHSRAVAPPVTSQVSGSALVVVDATPENPATLSVTNASKEEITFEADIDLQANIVIMVIPI